MEQGLNSKSILLDFHIYNVPRTRFLLLRCFLYSRLRFHEDLTKVRLGLAEIALPHTHPAPTKQRVKQTASRTHYIVRIVAQFKSVARLVRPAQRTAIQAPTRLAALQNPHGKRPAARTGRLDGVKRRPYLKPREENERRDERQHEEGICYCEEYPAQRGGEEERDEDAGGDGWKDRLEFLLGSAGRRR